MKTPIAAFLILSLISFSAVAGILRYGAAPHVEVDFCFVPSTAHPTIQAAIDDSSCDVIYIKNGTYNESLQIERNLTLTGPIKTNATIDGAGDSSTITIGKDLEVSLSHLTITGGAAIDDNGGGLLIGQESHVTIRDCDITENQAGSMGGGIYGEDIDLVIENSTLQKNAGIWGGGGIAIYGGTLTITKSDITENSSESSYGGGLYLSDLQSTAITKSNLNQNTAMLGGGAIYDNGNDDLQISQSLMYANNGLYGAIQTNNSKMTMTNSTISENSADTPTDGTGYIGTGIVGYGSQITLKNATIYANGTYGIVPDEKSKFEINHTIVAGHAGADCVLEDAGSATVVLTSTYSLDSDGSCALTGEGDLSDTDPQLLPLADNRGPTWTHNLNFESPAKNAGDCTLSSEVDQRGYKRPYGAGCDMGAVEWHFSPGEMRL